MPKFKITIGVEADFEVEAGDEQEAEEKAWDEWELSGYSPEVLSCETVKGGKR